LKQSLKALKSKLK